MGVAGQGSKQMNKIIVNGGSVYVFLSNSDGSVKKMNITDHLCIGQKKSEEEEDRIVFIFLPNLQFVL